LYRERNYRPNGQLSAVAAAVRRADGAQCPARAIGIEHRRSGRALRQLTRGV
jgi:hypothetical protein